jgi:hypothetical protein
MAVGKLNLDKLILYNDIRLDEIVNAAVRIFNGLEDQEYALDMEADYCLIQRKLLETVSRPDTEGTYWQNHICGLIAESENRFSLMCEKGDEDEQICMLALREMKELKIIYQMIGRDQRMLQDPGESYVQCGQSAMAGSCRNRSEKVKGGAEMVSDDAAVDILMDYYSENG